ncbi:hypothetical protein HB884_00370 [Listeria booriae]|uniref:hypothetical protein n=1 Tax=Listeria booriae TaxID=1552123 RepID=UPI0016269748|nr:hypothetical protein [Listeria booriae]MBC1522666.1 hypothetical protein [Listeria booriae]
MRTLKLLIEDLGLTISKVAKKGGLPTSTTFQFVNEKNNRESFAKKTPGRYYFAISDALGGLLSPPAVFEELITLETQVGLDFEQMVFTINGIIATNGKGEALTYLPELIVNFTKKEHYIEEYIEFLTKYIEEANIDEGSQD